MRNLIHWSVGDVAQSARGDWQPFRYFPRGSETQVAVMVLAHYATPGHIVRTLCGLGL